MFDKNIFSPICIYKYVCVCNANFAYYLSAFVCCSSEQLTETDIVYKYSNSYLQTKIHTHTFAAEENVG